MKTVWTGNGDLGELIIGSRAVIWIHHEGRFFSDVEPGPFSRRFDRIQGPRAAAPVAVSNNQGSPDGRGSVAQSVRGDKPAETALGSFPHAAAQRTCEVSLRN